MKIRKLRKKTLALCAGGAAAALALAAAAGTANAASASLTPYAQVVITSVSVTTHGATFSWTASYGSKGASIRVQAYDASTLQIRYDQTLPCSTTTSSCPKSFTATALSPGTAYDVRADVTASSTRSNSGWGAPRLFFTFALPGAAGPKGTTGATGIQGLTGAAGAPGIQGLTGADGAKGDTGATGLPGADGAKGDTGATGLPGADGAPGAKGDTGATGLPGADGAPGAKGDPGADGAPGPAGPSGVQALATSTLTPVNGIVTGGPFLSKATLLGTASLGAGTYQLCVNGKAEQPTVASGFVSAQMFVYDTDALANQSFNGDLLNVSADTQGGTHHDAYLNGCALVTEAGPVTLHVYGFGYDSDSSSGSWDLMTGAVTAIKLTPAA